MILENENLRPEIQFPCEWSYKIIGMDADSVLSAIEESVLNLAYDVTPSNLSKNGKYVSFNLKLEVPNETVRNLIYEKLKNHPDVNYVL